MTASLKRALPWIGVALAVAFGAWLRLSYPLDIEWKADEQWSFVHARAMLAGGPWPALGMPTSVSSPNPGLSLWVFAGLMWLSHAATGPELARAVQVANVAALALFVAFIAANISRARREPWLWAAALWAVNPLAMIFERKIWPPSVFPLPLVIFLWLWWRRRLWPCAFAWGALGALMAQVHLSAAFFALAVAAWTWIYDRRSFPRRAWLAGSVVGALPAIPWALATLHGATGALAHSWRAPILSFYVRWVTQPFGFGVDYSLGDDFRDFLAWPTVAGHATWLMAALHLGLIAVIFLLAHWGRRARRNLPPPWDIVFGDSPETVLIGASVFGYGAVLSLLTIAGADSARHYMIVVAPLMALWAAMAAFWAEPRRHLARGALLAACMLQAGISAGELAYIDHKGVIAGDYGAVWRVQPPALQNPS